MSTPWSHIDAVAELTQCSIQANVVEPRLVNTIDEEPSRLIRYPPILKAHPIGLSQRGIQSVVTNVLDCCIERELPCLRE